MAEASAPGAAEVLADAGAAIEALRQRGAAQGAPLAFHFVQALARRAVQHQGPTRALLDARLAGALAALARDWPGPDPSRPAAAAPGSADRPSPLAELVLRLNHRTPPAADAAAQGQAPGPTTPALAAPVPKQQALRGFQSRLARLSVDRQLQQSQARTPTNAGPLNSQRMVLRALQTMRALSPAYLDRFMAYADGLAWLDATLADERGPAAKAPGKARPGAGRSAARR